MNNSTHQNSLGQKESYAPHTPWQWILSLAGHKNSFLYGALLLAFIALLLRIYRLGDFELWLDEAYTYRQTVIVNWLGSLLRDNSPPFYNLLMRAWCSLFGNSETVMRLPSAICGALFVFTACYAGREIFNPRAGFWSGLIATFSPIHLYYSQEARNYSLLTLLLFLAILFLTRAVKGDRRRDWRLAALCALLALYTHYLAGLALLPLALIVLVWSPVQVRSQRFRTFGIYLAIILLLFSPWVTWSFLLTEHSLNGFSWMTAIWENLPPALAIPRSFEAFSFLTGPHLLQSKTEWSQSSWLLPLQFDLPARIFLTTIILWACIPCCDKKLNVTAVRQKKWSVLALLILPLILLWGGSLIQPLYLVSRYDLIVFPAFILLMGFVFTKTQQAGNRLVFIFLLICWFAPMGWIIYQYQVFPADSYKDDTAKLLVNNVQEGDVVVFTGNSSYATRYYLAQNGVECRNLRCTLPDGKFFPYRKYPTANEDEEAVYNEDEVLNDPQQVSRELGEFLSMRQGISSTLWIVLKSKIMEDNSLLLYYTPDAMLLDELGRRKIHCQWVVSDLTVFSCRNQ